MREFRINLNGLTVGVLKKIISDIPDDCEINVWDVGKTGFVDKTELEIITYEAVQGECRTCKRSSDYLWKNGENGTRCPIEEHYALPKDGYCHLHEPYKGGDTE